MFCSGACRAVGTLDRGGDCPEKKAAAATGCPSKSSFSRSHHMLQSRSIRRAFGQSFVLAVAAAIWATPSGAQTETSFPFNRELLLDVPPAKGSKRVPSLDIGGNGAAELDLWCNTVRSQLIVVGDTITFLAGPRKERACTPERMRDDEDMLTALTEVTNWRREGDVLVLTGPRTVRFRLQTN
jgi:heat shock protein HslJ